MVAFSLPGQSAKGDQPKMFLLQKFGSLNTQATRPGIGDQEFSWNENWQPVGDQNMRTLYGKGTTLYTAPSGKTIIYFYPFNIGSTEYIAVFLSDGTGFQVQISNGSVTTMSSAANTFSSASSDIPSCAQWGNSGILIVSTVTSSAYWAWDNAGGGTLYAPSSSAPLWLSGLAAALTPTGNSSAGSNIISSVSSTTSIVPNMTIKDTTNPTNLPANTTITTSSGGSLILSASASGTHSGDTFNINWAMPSGLSGTSVEIFQSRVWVFNANTNVGSFSAPSNGADFSTSDGGGTIKSSDSFLKSGWHCVKQANGFLYLFGDSSINVVSNVQTSGSPATTTFNNQNTDPQMGTPWPNTVQPFGRALLFANPSGVYALYGGAAEKVSPQLDGIFSTTNAPTGPPVATDYPSAAVMILNGVKVYILNMDILDPFTGTHRQAMLIWDGRRWFVGSQESAPIFVNSQEVNSNLTPWGTDGTILFQLFNKKSSTLTKKFQSKLWSGQSEIFYKNVLRAYVEAMDNAGGGMSFTYEIDNENGASGTLSLTNANVLTFQNNSGSNLQFQNNSGANISFTIAGLSINGQNANARGKLIGLTVTTTSEDLTMVSTGLLYQEQMAYA